MSKEKKPTQSPSKDPEIKFDRSQFFQNRLQLPQALKDKLAADGLDFRFLNASQYRYNGNRHQSHWRAYVVEGNPAELGITGLTPEKHIQVGDLILGVREKRITQAHKDFINDRNRRLAGYNKEKAKEMRSLAREHGVTADSKVFEGYEDNGDE